MVKKLSKRTDEERSKRADYVLTECSACHEKMHRRKDQLKNWSGLCKTCASKEIANRPYVKQILRENGKKMMALNGHNVVKRGDKHFMWRGGISSENELIRNSIELRKWRQDVYARDNFTCQICSERGGKLHADHIKPFSLFPELRTNIDNGRTLCVSCHKKHGARVWRGRWVNKPENLAA